MSNNLDNFVFMTVCPIQLFCLVPVHFVVVVQFVFFVLFLFFVMMSSNRIERIVAS